MSDGVKFQSYKLFSGAREIDNMQCGLKKITSFRSTANVEKIHEDG